MDFEQLEKMNKLVKELDKIKMILFNRYDKCEIREHKVAPEHFDPIDWGIYHVVILDKKIIEPALIAYSDELKRELKNFGYEDK
ncbi:MAG: hypothetical protein LBB81_01425 [Treponema sp.]|jgi:hypothetical protein|nr:hypothetical protein [Treponema sp.]